MNCILLLNIHYCKVCLNHRYEQVAGNQKPHPPSSVRYCPLLNNVGNSDHMLVLACPIMTAKSAPSRGDLDLT